MINAFFHNIHIKDQSTPTRNLEEWEKEFLYNTFTSETEHNNIDNGMLSQSMIHKLEDAKKVYDYLHPKYPSYSFKIKQKKQEGSPIPTDIVYLFTEDGSDIEYKAYQHYDMYKDNFYNEIYSSKYSDFIKEELEKANIKIASINTTFVDCKDASVGENLSIKELKDLRLSCSTNIYVNNKLGCTDEELINIVKDLGIHGYYYIFKSDLFTFGMTADECERIIINDEKNKEKYRITSPIDIN